MTDIATLHSYMLAAQSESCRMNWAREWIRARFEAGEFPMLQALDAATLEAMARATVKEMDAS